MPSRKFPKRKRSRKPLPIFKSRDRHRASIQRWNHPRHIMNKVMRRCVNAKSAETIVKRRRSNAKRRSEAKRKVYKQMNVKPRHHREDSYSSRMSRSESRSDARRDQRREQRPDQRWGQRPEQRREQRPDQRRDQRPEQRRDQRREHRPDQRREQGPEQRREHRPDHRREQEPDHRREQRPDHRREQRPEERPWQRRQPQPEAEPLRQPPSSIDSICYSTCSSYQPDSEHKSFIDPSFRPKSRLRSVPKKAKALKRPRKKLPTLKAGSSKKIQAAKATRKPWWQFWSRDNETNDLPNQFSTRMGEASRNHRFNGIDSIVDLTGEPTFSEEQLLNPFRGPPKGGRGNRANQMPPY